MAKVGVYNLTGEKMKDIIIDDAVFGVEIKKDLIHQVYVALRANARQPWAHTKDRSEVRGGGKKPWKQKGTGRARHGSIRSPLWSGGGVTFGPLKTRSYKQKINKKMNVKAVKMCLSDKVLSEKMFVLDSVDFQGKTKNIDTLRNALPTKSRTTLVVTEKKDDALLLAARNIKKFDVIRAQDLNVVDLLNHQYILGNEAALNVLVERLTK